MLCDLCPDVPDYKLYYAQSLYQSGLFEEAIKVTNTIEADHLKEKVLQLQSAIYFSNEDYAASQSILLQRQVGSAQTLNDEGCLLYQANLHDDALQRFFTSLQTGFNPLTAYNAALCHYRKKEYSQSLNLIGEVIERGIRNYPELGIGAQAETEGGARSVGNPPALSLSGLVQALNLKAAIEYQEGNVEASREALMDLPPRSEPELDPVTLHNMALTGDQSNGTVKLRRLAFLLELGPICPLETFSNLLILCCKHEMFDTAADILAEHAQLTYKYLSPFLYDLLDAIITSQTSLEEAEKKLGVLSSSLSTRLRTLSSKVQECRMASDQNALRNALREYESVLHEYEPVAMTRAYIYWRENDFTSAEREFRASAEFCSETTTWRLHAAHVLFMRGDKYKEAAAFYEPIVRQSYEDVRLLKPLQNILVSSFLVPDSLSVGDCSGKSLRRLHHDFAE
jgi:tetratricopeptide repeat protein 30